jgi:hypothetical protein
MMKRLLFPGCLFFFIGVCLCITAPANAQDTTKKAEPEKKVEPEKKEVAQTATPPKAKPLYRYHRIHPAVPANATSAAAANAAHINDSSLKANSLKAQQAQPQPGPAQIIDKSLKGQYQYLLTKVFNYQQPLISALWKNVTDTLNYERGKVKDLQTKLAAENKVTDSLKTEAKNVKQQTESESAAKIDTISLFGLVMTKTSYNLVMFGLVIGLAAALTIVVLTTAKYKYEAKHRTELYEEIEEEYKNYKSKANEKELKLARELQTERNKLDELLGRG